MAHPKKTSKRATKSGAVKEKKKVPQRRCFTIMPFGGWYDEYYETVFNPAIREAKLIADRADDLYASSAIVNDIWEMTKRADVVLADLSGKNANVFYELGLAHAIAKPAILVSSSLEDVPFDLRSLRVIIYDKNDPNWGQDLTRDITAALRETLERPTESVLPTFLGKLPPTSQVMAAVPPDIELAQIRQEVRALRNHLLGPGALLGSSPSAARRMIGDLVEQGLSESAIIRRAVDGGLPASWVRRELVLARHRVAETSGSASTDRSASEREAGRSGSAVIDPGVVFVRGAQRSNVAAVAG